MRVALDMIQPPHFFRMYIIVQSGAIERDMRQRSFAPGAAAPVFPQGMKKPAGTSPQRALFVAGYQALRVCQRSWPNRPLACASIV